jgi:exosortase family protein XrtG
VAAPIRFRTGGEGAMTTQTLSLLAVLYLAGLVALRRARYTLLGYLWAAFGFAALGILTSQVGQWNVALGRVEVATLVRAGGWLGLEAAGLQRSSLVVPDPTGWSILNIGLECSTLIEAFIFVGLLLFYPRFSGLQRLQRMGIGLASLYLLNLVRLAVIIGMIMLWGKPAAALAHAVVARLVFFVGMIAIYWWLLTRPTLGLIRREMEVTGRAVL